MGVLEFLTRKRKMPEYLSGPLDVLNKIMTFPYVCGCGPLFGLVFATMESGPMQRFSRAANPEIEVQDFGNFMDRYLRGYRSLRDAFRPSVPRAS